MVYWFGNKSVSSLGCSATWTLHAYQACLFTNKPVIGNQFVASTGRCGTEVEDRFGRCCEERPITLIEEETWRLQTKKYLQSHYLLFGRDVIFPFSTAADISSSASLPRAVMTEGETKMHDYCKCSFDKFIWLYTYNSFSRQRWISWWKTTKSVGSRTASFSLQKIPVCHGRLCTGLWECRWLWNSSAFWPRYILCPHQVNN